MLWLELVWPCRRVWAGLAAVWVIIVLVNLHLAGPRSVMTAQNASSPQNGWQAIREQQQLIAELTAQVPPVTVPAGRFTPRPRSEIMLQFITA
jgi:hypothetical protein